MSIEIRVFCSSVGVVAGVVVSLHHGLVSAEEAPVVPRKLAEVLVVGNPLDTGDVVVPASSLTGERLLLKRAATLGETLGAETGVSSTWYGPNASRPTIRGLDGDRIRILSNQGASFDASSLSPDHAVALDPLVIERIEVLRGPAALLYGGAAVGGVVNVVDNRIPRQPVATNAPISGAVELRGGGADRERSRSMLLEAGVGAFSVHADGFARDSSNYRVPTSTGVPSPVVNSAADASGGALGMSWSNAHSYAGLAHSDYASHYGTVAEPGVRIDMKQSRDTGEASVNKLAGLIEGFTLRASRSRYEHTELDEGEPQTTFRNRGDEARLELKHAAWRLGDGKLQGLVGVQWEKFAFSALGAEAFVPRTNTRNQALFLFEEWKQGALSLSAGARVENSKVHSEGGEAEGISRFGSAAQRDFRLLSASIGGNLKLAPGWTLSTNLARSERAPTFYELYAEGPHGATGAYEVGSRNFGIERSNAVDLGLRWNVGATELRVNAFSQRIDHYLTLLRSGRDRDAEGNGAMDGVTDCGDGTSLESGCVAELLPEFVFNAVSARLRGFEIEGKWRLFERRAGWDSVDLELKADSVRADDLSHHTPLPRIAPMRVSAGLMAARGPHSVRLDLQHVARQDRVSADDLLGTTSGYTLLNAAATFEQAWGRTVATFFVRGTNLTNQKAFNAGSIDTIRALAPLPGRGVKAGVLVRF